MSALISSSPKIGCQNQYIIPFIITHHNSKLPSLYCFPHTFSPLWSPFSLVLWVSFALWAIHSPRLRNSKQSLTETSQQWRRITLTSFLRASFTSLKWASGYVRPWAIFYVPGGGSTTSLRPSQNWRGSWIHDRETNLYADFARKLM